MTLEVSMNSLLATFIKASKMAKRNQDKKSNCWSWGWNSMVELFCSVHKALGSIPTPPQKN